MSESIVENLSGESSLNCYVSQITFNNGEVLDVAKNDIIIFVGPNNAGKSQSLKDIYTLMEKDIPTTVVKKIDVVKTGTQNFKELAERISFSQNNGSYINYQGYGYSFSSYFIDQFSRDKSLGEARGLFVSYLDTENRLMICNPPNAINEGEVKQHPIHYIVSEPDYRRLISDNFKRAFGKELIPHTSFGRQIPLCIGEAVHLDYSNFTDMQECLEAYRGILNTYAQVQKQGDGIRSFTGVLLNLIIKTYCTYLIDEPESFLHPPQAKIMGHVIGSLLDERQQAFISTHSQDIIKGLLEVCPERIKIVRITREGDVNNFAILKNEQFDLIWKDPLLKYSEIMNSLFHKSVVLCESDSDCRLYSIILSHIKSKSNSFSETLFIHCGGKQRMPKVIKALRALNIKLLVIPDIDILNDEGNIKRIIESCGDDWEKYKLEYRKLSGNLITPKSFIVRDEAKIGINSIIDDSEEKNLSSKEIENIISLLKIETKWGLIKKGGKESIPNGDAYSAYEKINSQFKSIGVFLVPVGELENFVKGVGGHGPEWVNKVLETYPNLDDNVYDKIMCFVKSWNL